MYNFINVFCSRRRWLKRIVNKHLDEVANVILKDSKLNIFYNPKDLRGPSFHLAYDLEKGFNNYEEIDKKEIIDSLPKNGILVDIGANIGLFSLYILNKRTDVTSYAFEPEPRNFYCINESKKANKMVNLRLSKCAIGKEEGKFSLYKENDNDGGHSLLLNSSKKTEENSILVKVLTLENALPADVERIDVIKIDVEGAESIVLEGSINLIKKYKPMMLIESSNINLSNRTEIFEVFQSNFNAEITARIPGSKEKMNLEELSIYAGKCVKNNITISNYVYEFVNR